MKKHCELEKLDNTRLMEILKNFPRGIEDIF